MEMDVPDTVQCKLLLLREEVMKDERISAEVRIELSGKLNQLSIESGKEARDAKDKVRADTAELL